VCWNLFSIFKEKCAGTYFGTYFVPVAVPVAGETVGVPDFPP
jgi:hypothetical protein